MPFVLDLTNEAKAGLRELERDGGLAKRLRAVQKTLARLESDPRHPALQSHRFRSLSGPGGEDVYEVYAEQGTPAAYRVLWYYGPERHQIIVVRIMKHP